MFLGVFFLCGSCLLQFFRTLPSLWWLLVFAPMFIFIFIIRKEYFKYFTRFTLFVAGFSWALIYAHLILAWELPKTLESKNVEISGYIASLPETDHFGETFNFKTDKIAGAKQHVLLHLSWFKNHPLLRPGDKWQLLVRLKRPHGNFNPGGFDYEQYLFVHKIRATGYVVNSLFNQVQDKHWYHFPFLLVRELIRAKISAALFNHPLTGVVEALVLGDESNIAKPDWQILRVSGTSYLVAIAGLHIGLVATAVGFVVNFLWRRSKKLPLTIPARHAAICCGLFAAIIYSIISGFSIPTERALTMLIIFSLALILRRNNEPWRTFNFALIVVLILNPLSVLTAGFWLSFAAVFAIIFVFNARIGVKHSFIKKYFSMQWAVTICLLPITLFLFKAATLVAIIANIIALPGVCLIVVPLCLFGALLILFIPIFGGWMLWLGVKLLELIWQWLAFFASFSIFNWQQPIFHWWIFIAAMIGVVILLLPRGFPAKYLGMLWLVPLIFYAPAQPKFGEIWFTLLDVGQGLATVIQTKNHALIYDTGPKFFNNDAGASVVVPFLENSNIRIIDALVVSHGDNDHIGGAATILKTIPVRNIISSVPERFLPKLAANCYALQSWQWDGVDFSFLAPERKTNFTDNDASCVLKISNKANAILLTGDIEKPAENLLLALHEKSLFSTILVAPHHGSATSSQSKFIMAISPKSVLFPIGYHNKFHFPAPSVVKRYLLFGASMFNTASSGAISFNLTTKSGILTPLLYREQVRRYWND